MTGFGRGAGTFKDKKFIVEIKSLNSKSIDINSKNLSNYKEKELEIRTLISQYLERGKIDFAIAITDNYSDDEFQINEKLLVAYYRKLNDISEKYALNLGNEMLSTLLKIPDVLKGTNVDIDDEEWETLKKVIITALENCNEYRATEGKELEKDLLANNDKILEMLSNISEYEEERILAIKEKLRQNLTNIANNENFDSNRYEQEIIYYIEKLDINEEKIRLKKHCEYLIETIKNEKNQGKKLGFIAQEMGREINTLGSKANHVEIQKNVVMMKEYLEKIKEQLLNVL